MKRCMCGDSLLLIATCRHCHQAKFVIIWIYVIVMVGLSEMVLRRERSLC